MTEVKLLNCTASAQWRKTSLCWLMQFGPVGVHMGDDYDPTHQSSAL